MTMTADFKEFGRGKGEVRQATQYKKRGGKGNRSKQKKEMFSRRKKMT